VESSACGDSEQVPAVMVPASKASRRQQQVPLRRLAATADNVLAVTVRSAAPCGTRGAGQTRRTVQRVCVNSRQLEVHRCAGLGSQ
jgi:hypothetical protein